MDKSEIKNDKMSEVIDRIKSRRIELKLSYQDLANATGLSKSTLQRYETGYIKNIPVDKLELLAAALETTPAALMGWDYLKQEADVINQDLSTIDKRIAYYHNFRTILKILGYQVSENWSTDNSGNQIDLIESDNFQIQIPHSAYKELMNSSLSYIEFRMKEFFDTFQQTVRNKQYDHLSANEILDLHSEPDQNDL